MSDTHEVTLTISRVKEEHVGWTVNALNVLSGIFHLDGTDVGIDLSVERNRDGVERFAEFIELDNA